MVRIITKLTVKAYAKINLTLGITGKRTDGYHLIDTIMQSVDLYDTLAIEKSDRISVLCKELDIKNEDNIAFRAASLFYKECNFNGGAKINIEKRIPAAAGLGGGSADAAAVLVALDKIYETGLSYDKLCGMALKLGADVPFFIHGGTQRAQGIGEILTPLKPLQKGNFILLKKDSKPSTAQMYRDLDKKSPSLPDTQKAIDAISNQNLKMLADSFYNSFISVWNESDTQKLLTQTNPLAVSLSGSGPTWFALFNDSASAKTAQNKLNSLNIKSYSVKPCDFSLKFE